MSRTKVRVAFVLDHAALLNLHDDVYQDATTSTYRMLVVSPLTGLAIALLWIKMA